MEEFGGHTGPTFAQLTPQGAPRLKWPTTVVSCCAGMARTTDPTSLITCIRILPDSVIFMTLLFAAKAIQKGIDG